MLNIIEVNMEYAINVNDIKVGSVVFSLFNKHFKTIKKEKVKLTNIDSLKVLAVSTLRNSGHEEYGNSTTVYELMDANGNIFSINANHVSLKAKDTSSMLYYVISSLGKVAGLMLFGWLVFEALTTTNIF